MRRCLAILAALAALTPVCQAQPKLMVQKGHTFTIRSLTLSADAKWLVTASADQSARLWETATGREIRVFPHHDKVSSASLSADGKWLATGSGGSILLEINHAEDKVSPHHSPNCATLWNVETGRIVRTFPSDTGAINAVALSADGKWLVTAGDDNTPRLWDVLTGKPVREFKGHTNLPGFRGGVNSVAFSRDGAWLATGGDDNSTRVWNVATGKEIRVFQGKVSSVVFSRDGKLLLSANGYDLAAKLHSIESGKLVRTFPHDKFVSQAAISPDGTHVFTSSASDPFFRMWNVATGKVIRTFRDKGTDERRYDSRLVLSDDGKSLFTAEGDWGYGARHWNPDTGEQIRAYQGHAETVNAVSLSDDGSRLVTASGTHHFAGGRNAHLWDLAAGRQVRVFRGHTDSVRSAALTRDGKRLLTGSNDDTARLWDADTGKCLRVVKAHTGIVTAVALSRDGQWLLTGSGELGSIRLGAPEGEQEFSARIWDFASGKQLRHFEHYSDEGGSGVSSAAISHDKKWLVTTGRDEKARLWDTATGRKVRDFQGHKAPTVAVTLSPDSRNVFTGSLDGTACVWDRESGRKIRAFNGHTGPVVALALSADGERLATAGYDKDVRLWNVASGKTIRTFQGHDGNITCIALSGDGKRLITASDDATTRIWDLASGKELCRLISFCDGSWIVFDAEGRYDAPGPVQGLHWVDGMKSMSVQQFKDDLYDPDLLAKHLGHHREPPRKVAKAR